MTKDSFREKRCLVFMAFSKVLVFASQEGFGGFFVWHDQLYFIIFLWLVVCSHKKQKTKETKNNNKKKETKKKKNQKNPKPRTTGRWWISQGRAHVLHPCGSQHTCTAAYSSPFPLNLVGTAWCTVQGEGIAPMNLASVLDLNTGMLPQSCVWVWAQLTFHNHRAHKAQSWNFFLALSPVSSLFCHSLSQRLWICSLFH